MSGLDKIKKKIEMIEWKGISSLIAGFLIQFTLGAFYSFGNMTTYMTSYMRHHGSPNITYGDTILVQSVWGMTQGVSMPISGFLISYIGDRVAIFLGCSIFSAGAALTYFTINTNIYLVAFTYGFISAFGQGIALIPTMTICMKWFPHRKGMAMGIVVGGFGGGSFAFNQIQTAILNPDNISPVKSKTGNESYFEDETLLNRVPQLMLILGAIYFTISFIAGCMMIPPETKENSDDNSNSVVGQNINMDRDDDDVSQENVTKLDAVRDKNFYFLWLTRFSVVLMTQLVAGFYKSFGQTFIKDDLFLSMVGSICSIFNCSSRLFYGLLMDKTCYKYAMITEAILLTFLFSTYYFSTMVGKALFAVMTWAIFFTFPGTYAIMPAVTVQTYGHKNGGTIYGLFFSADIPNNLIIALASKKILDNLGYFGLFLLASGFGIIALICTALFPKNPEPSIIVKRTRINRNNRGNTPQIEMTVRSDNN